MSKSNRENSKPDFRKIDALLDLLDEDTKRDLMRLGFLRFKEIIFRTASAFSGFDDSPESQRVVSDD